MKRRAFVAAFAAALLAACAPKAQGPAITAEKGVLQPPAVGQSTAAGYFTLRNGGGEGDRLVSATSPAAASVEIHSHMMMDGGGMMMMKVDGVDVPAGKTVEFKTGGYHLMLFGYTPQTRGDTPVTLTFAKSGDVQVVLKTK